MKHTHVVVLASMFLAACKPGGSPDHAGPAHGEGRPLSFTHFGTQTALFVEFEPLVAGQATKMAAHLTRLDDWKPLTDGRVVVSLSGGGPEERFEVQGPSTPGIFRPAPRPEGAGQRRVVLTVVTPSGTDTHDLGEVTVHPTPTPPPRRLRGTREGGGYPLPHGTAVEDRVRNRGGREFLEGLGCRERHAPAGDRTARPT